MKFAILNVDCRLDIGKVVLGGFVLEAAADVTAGEGLAVGLQAELVETEIVVVLELWEGLFLGDPVAELDA